MFFLNFGNEVSMILSFKHYKKFNQNITRENVGKCFLHPNNISKIPKIPFILEVKIQN